MTTNTAPGPGPSAWTAGTADLPRLPLWQVPTFVAGLLAVLAVAATTGHRSNRAVRQFERDLTHVRQALAQPSEPAENIVDLAESLVSRIGAAPDRAGEVHLLLGIVYARLAEQPPADRAKELRGKALDQLHQAEGLGVPAADLPRLQYCAGKLLYLSGGGYPRVIEYLSRSIAQGADDPAAGYHMLTVAYLRLQPPDYDGALKANQKQLEATSSEEAMPAVRLLRGEILFNKGLRREALRVLERIGPTAPLAVCFPARCLQARCCQEEGLYNQAVPLWNEVLAMPQLPPGSQGRILFVLGLCYHHLDPPDNIGAARAWEQAVQAGGDDGQAASLCLAELSLAGPNPDAALEHFRRALAPVTTAADLRSPLVSLKRVRELLDKGCQTFRDARDFARAQQLARLYQKLAEPGRADERFAEISEAWAKDLQEQGLKAGAPSAASLEEQARARFREAGAAYEHAAAARPPAEQAALLWRGSACYSLAREDAKALAVLERFLRLPVSPERQAEAWFALGEAQRALKHPQEARQAYYKSIEVPTSPVASRARYQLAVAEIERKDFEQAEAILRQNLRAVTSAAERADHEKSVYLLGELLYKRGEFLEASVHLKEAARQYPANPGALAARAHLGECYLKLAQQEADKLKSPEGYAGAQVHLVRRRQEWLESALKVYQKLADQLEGTSSKSPGQDEIALLRQASFAVADCRYALGELAEALRLYNLLFRRYAHQAESLQALLRIYQCYHLLSGPDKSAALNAYRAALRTARTDLPSIPANAFAQKGPGSREYWQRWLTQQEALLTNPPSSPASERP